MRCSRRSARSAIPQIVVYNKIDRLELAPRIDRDADGRATRGVDLGSREASGSSGCSRPLPSGSPRATRRARLWIPASGGALRSRLYAAHVVREEQPSEDGSIELTVDLPMLELLSLARTSGVRILEVAADELACAACGGLPTICALFGRYPASLKLAVSGARHSIKYSYGLESTRRAVNRVLGVGAPAASSRLDERVRNGSAGSNRSFARAAPRAARSSSC